MWTYKHTTVEKRIPYKVHVAVYGSALDGVQGIVGVYASYVMAEFHLKEVAREHKRDGAPADYYAIQTREMDSNRVSKEVIIIDNTVDPDDLYSPEPICDTDERG